MRSLIPSLVLVAGLLGLIGLTPAPAQAGPWGWPPYYTYYYPAYSAPMYYTYYPTYYRPIYRTIYVSPPFSGYYPPYTSNYYAPAFGYYYAPYRTFYNPVYVGY